MKDPAEIIEFLEELKTNASNVLQSSFNNPGTARLVNRQLFSQLLAKSQILIKMLGAFAEEWKETFSMQTVSTQSNAMAVSGAIDGILECVKKGRLTTIAEQVSVEILGDLREHASVLYDNNHFLAACVVARSILEERLRLLCQKRNCVPTKPRSTISDFNDALYKQFKDSGFGDYDKTILNWVTSMATTGNTAAHAIREINHEETERMLRDLDSFLAKFSL